MAAKKPPKQPVARADSRSLLVETTLDIVLEHGIEAVRIDDVLARVGLTKGSLYWHFTDRTDLVKAALLEYVRRLNEDFVSGMESAIAESDNQTDYLLRIAPFIVDPYDPQQSLARRQRLTLLLEANANPDFAPMMQEVQAKSLTIYAELMRNAQSRGFLRADLDPRAVATALHAINFGSIIIDVVGDAGPSREAWWGLMTFFISQLFSPTEPPV